MHRGTGFRRRSRVRWRLGQALPQMRRRRRRKRQRTASPRAETPRQPESATQRETPPKPVAVRPAGPPPEFRGPDITLIASEERSVYEFRQNGQLRMIKVVPKFGKPYYLAPRDPTTGFGDLEQADSLIAEWVLWEF